MTALQIVQLIITLGPGALELIPKLQAMWTRPVLSTEEVLDICQVARKSYDDYTAGSAAAVILGKQ